MTFGQIYNDMCRIAWGDTVPPESVMTSYRGSSGVIARARRRIMQDFNYWFMEASSTISLVVDQRNYNLPADFKEEVSIFVKNDDGDIFTELKKLSQNDYMEYVKKYSQPSVYDDSYSTPLEDNQNTEWPSYYYILPTSTVGQLEVLLLPIPEEAKTDAIYIVYWKYLPDLSDTVATWDAYEDEISTNCPDLLIWMGVADIAMIQENQRLMALAEGKVAQFKDEFKNINFTLKNSNMGRIPYPSI